MQMQFQIQNTSKYKQFYDLIVRQLSQSQKTQQEQNWTNTWPIQFKHTYDKVVGRLLVSQYKDENNLLQAIGHLKEMNKYGVQSYSLQNKSRSLTQNLRIFFNNLQKSIRIVWQQLNLAMNDMKKIQIKLFATCKNQNKNISIIAISDLIRQSSSRILSKLVNNQSKSNIVRSSQNENLQIQEKTNSTVMEELEKLKRTIQLRDKEIQSLKDTVKNSSQPQNNLNQIIKNMQKKQAILSVENRRLQMELNQMQQNYRLSQNYDQKQVNKLIYKPIGLLLPADKNQQLNKSEQRGYLKEQQLQKKRQSNIIRNEQMQEEGKDNYIIKYLQGKIQKYQKSQYQHQINKLKMENQIKILNQTILNIKNNYIGQDQNTIVQTKIITQSEVKLQALQKQIKMTQSKTNNKHLKQTIKYPTKTNSASNQITQQHFRNTQQNNIQQLSDKIQNLSHVIRQERQNRQQFKQMITYVANTIKNADQPSQQQQKQQILQPLQFRDKQIKIKLKELSSDSKLLQKQCEQWLLFMLQSIISSSFNSYLNGSMTFIQTKVFCAKQIIANSLRFCDLNKRVLQANQNLKLKKMMEKIIKQLIVQKYPMIEQKKISYALQKLVKSNEISNFSTIQNDFLVINKIQFQKRNDGNYNDVIMRTINTMIQITNKQYDMFRGRFQDIFHMIQNQDWMKEQKEELKVDSNLNLNKRKTDNIAKTYLHKITNYFFQNNSVEKEPKGSIDQTDRSTSFNKTKSMKQSMQGSMTQSKTRPMRESKVGSMQGPMRQSKTGQNKQFNVFSLILDSKQQKQQQSSNKKNESQQIQKQQSMMQQLAMFMQQFGNQSTNESMKQLMKQSMKQSMKELIKQSMKQSIQQSMRQSKRQRIKQGDKEPSKQARIGRIGKIKYKESVKAYTSYNMNRKIPETVQPFTQDQISTKNIINIKDNSIFRIIVKWCDQLEEKFEKPQFIDDIHRIKDQNNIIVLKKIYKNQLKTLINNKRKTMNNYKSELIKNLLQLQSKLLLDSKIKTQNCQLFGAVFCYDISDISQKLIIKYLNKLIHGLLQVGEQFHSYLITKNMIEGETEAVQEQFKPNLVTLKIGDLLRCNFHSHQLQIINIFRQLFFQQDFENKTNLPPSKSIQQTSQSKKIPYQIIRIKNRLKQSTNDILINVKFCQVICEIQMGIKQEYTNFQKCSNKFNHFLYELIRAKFGVISELCSIEKKFDKRIKYFYKNRKLMYPPQSLKDSQCLKIHSQNKIQLTNDKLLYCSYCKQLIFHLNYIIPHKYCNLCNFISCSDCQSQIYTNKQLIQMIDNLDLTNQPKWCKNSIPRSGICIQRQSKNVKLYEYFQKEQFDQTYFLTVENNKTKLSEKQIELGIHLKHIQKISNNLEKKEKDQLALLKKYLFFAISSPIKNNYTQNQIQKFLSIKNIQKVLKNFTNTLNIQGLNLSVKQSLKILNLKQSYQDYNQQSQLKDKLRFIRYFSLTKNRFYQNEQLFFKSLKLFVNLTWLDLRNNRIQKWPVDLKFYILQKLDLSENNLTSFVIEMKKLQVLNLSHNKLEQINIGQRNQNDQAFCIKELDLSNNLLKQINHKFIKVQTITKLNLSQNSFTEFPKPVFTWNNLTQLFINSNDLKKITEDISNLKKLQIFQFSKNKFEECYVSSNTFECPKLKKLDLNSRMKIISPTNAKLIQLSICKINLSKIQPKIIQSILNSMPNVQNLYINNEQKEQIQINFSNLSKLKIFQMIGGKISIISFHGLSQLTSISLKNVTISDHSVFDLTKHPLLKKLQILTTKVKLNENHFACLAKLQILHLTKSLFQQFNLQMLQNCKNLKILSFGQNQILMSIPLSLNKLSQLQQLNLTSNNISVIDHQCLNIVHLKKLNLSKNNLQKVQKLFQKLAKLKHLSYLNLSECKLKTIGQQISCCTQLNYLNLTKNKIINVSSQISKSKGIQTFQFQVQRIKQINREGQFHLLFFFATMTYLRATILLQLGLKLKDNNFNFDYQMQFLRQLQIFLQQNIEQYKQKQKIISKKTGFDMNLYDFKKQIKQIEYMLQNRKQLQFHIQQKIQLSQFKNTFVFELIHPREQQKIIIRKLYPFQYQNAKLNKIIKIVQQLQCQPKYSHIFSSILITFETKSESLYISLGIERYKQNKQKFVIDLKNALIQIDDSRLNEEESYQIIKIQRNKEIEVCQLCSKQLQIPYFSLEFENIQKFVCCSCKDIQNLQQIKIMMNDEITYIKRQNKEKTDYSSNCGQLCSICNERTKQKRFICLGCSLGSHKQMNINYVWCQRCVLAGKTIDFGHIHPYHTCKHSFLQLKDSISSIQ